MKTLLAAALLLGAVSTADAQCISFGGRGFGISVCAPTAYAPAYGGGGYYGYRPYFGGRDWRVPGPAPGVLRDPTGALRGYPPLPSPPIYVQRPAYVGPPPGPPPVAVVPDTVPSPAESETVPQELPPPPNLPPGQPDNKFMEFCAANPNAPPCVGRVRGQR